MPEVIDRGWEHQKAISPLPLGGFRDPGGLARSVLVDAANDGHGLRHLVQRHLEDTLLLFEGQRRNLRSVGVGGDDTPENQLRPHRKTSPRSALAALVTLASQPASFTESSISETRASQSGSQ